MANFIGIDLFSGAGGMTVGAKRAGVNVMMAVESDRYAVKTYKANHPEALVHADDIANLTEIPIVRSSNDVTILFGGPPCQGFSTSNQRTRTSKNAGNWLYKEFLRVTALWEPDWVVFENVKGITDTEGGLFLEQTLNDLTHLGYSCVCGVLNAVDFGVPQKRSRLFVVATRHRLKVALPVSAKTSHVPVKDALSDLPFLTNGAAESFIPYRDVLPSDYANAMRGQLISTDGHLVTKNASYVVERYRHVSPGGNWEDIPMSLMDNYRDRSRCHTGIYHRIHPDRPSIVIGNYRKNMLIHPHQDRGLSVREAARIQSFPDSYSFKGSIGFQQQQVGNAVPPLLAHAVFEVMVKL